MCQITACGEISNVGQIITLLEHPHASSIAKQLKALVDKPNHENEPTTFARKPILVSFFQSPLFIFEVIHNNCVDGISFIEPERYVQRNVGGISGFEEVDRNSKSVHSYQKRITVSDPN